MGLEERSSTTRQITDTINTFDQRFFAFTIMINNSPYKIFTIDDLPFDYQLHFVMKFDISVLPILHVEIDYDNDGKYQDCHKTIEIILPQRLFDCDLHNDENDKLEQRKEFLQQLCIGKIKL